MPDSAHRLGQRHDAEEFDGTTVTYATSYGLRVDDLTSNTFYVIYRTGLAGTSFTPATALAGNHTFSAHVQAGNQFGYGYWSQPYIFATETRLSARRSTFRL